MSTKRKSDIDHTSSDRQAEKKVTLPETRLYHLYRLVTDVDITNLPPDLGRIVMEYMLRTFHTYMTSRSWIPFNEREQNNMHIQMSSVLPEGPILPSTESIVLWQASDDIYSKEIVPWTVARYCTYNGWEPKLPIGRITIGERYEILDDKTTEYDYYHSEFKWFLSDMKSVQDTKQVVCKKEGSGWDHVHRSIVPFEIDSVTVLIQPIDRSSASPGVGGKIESLPKATDPDINQSYSYDVSDGVQITDYMTPAQLAAIYTTAFRLYSVTFSVDL